MADKFRKLLKSGGVFGALDGLSPNMLIRLLVSVEVPDSEIGKVQALIEALEADDDIIAVHTNVNL